MRDFEWQTILFDSGNSLAWTGHVCINVCDLFLLFLFFVYSIKVNLSFVYQHRSLVIFTVSNQGDNFVSK